LINFQEKNPYSPLIPIRGVLIEKRSRYQKIEIYETIDMGNMLVLDNAVQTTEKDEFIYHEMITYPSFLLAKNHKNALIIGGGDCGVAKELLKLDRTMDIEIVEIDKEVINVSKEFFPWAAKALRTVKTTLSDGGEFLTKNREERDMIIIDSTDPTPLAEGLFSEELYRNAASLSDVVVAQTESPIANREVHRRAIGNMKKVFKNVYTYYTFIPTYPGGIFSFSIGTGRDLRDMSSENIRGKCFSRDLFLSSMRDFTKDIFEP